MGHWAARAAEEWREWRTGRWALSTTCSCRLSSCAVWLVGRNRQSRLRSRPRAPSQGRAPHGSACAKVTVEMPNGVTLRLECGGQDVELVSAMIVTLGRLAIGPTWRAIDDTLTPCQCNSRAITISPSPTNEPPLAWKGHRRPSAAGFPQLTWGKSNWHIWGAFSRRSHTGKLDLDPRRRRRRALEPLQAEWLHSRSERRRRCRLPRRAWPPPRNLRQTCPGYHGLRDDACRLIRRQALPGRPFPVRTSTRRNSPFALSLTSDTRIERSPPPQGNQVLRTRPPNKGIRAPLFARGRN